MPVCLRPDKTFKFALKGDHTIPLAQRPHFLCRFLSSAERANHVGEVEIIDRNDLKTLDTKRNEVIRKVVAGVANMSRPSATVENPGGVTPLTLDELLGAGDFSLTNGERWELLWGALNEQEMTEDDIKN